MSPLVALALALSAPAHAGALTVSATGGYDFPTANPWAGAELALHPTHTRGLGLTGRLAPGWAFIDGQPVVVGEVGLLGVVPEDEATVRVGAVVRVVGIRAEHALPLDLAAGDLHTGLVPGVMAALEFEWGERSPFTFGARGGVGSAIYDNACPDQGGRPECLEWGSSFIGGFTARLRLARGLSLEAVVGPTAHLSVGWAL